MDKRNDGGPAFPNDPDMWLRGNSATNNEDRERLPLNEECGMSLRDYLAAHAPAEPQPWFKPVMNTPRPQPHDFDRDGNAANSQEIHTWDRAAIDQTYIQWPYAWADAMLRERERGSAENELRRLAGGKA